MTTTTTTAKTKTAATTARTTRVNRPKTPSPDQPERAGRAGWVHRVEWSWRHGPVIGPVNAVLGAAGTAMVGDLAGASPWWAAGAGAVAAGTVAARAANRGVSRAGVAYRAGCWAGAGAWTSWALATSPWSVDTLAGLLAGGLVAGLAGAELGDHEQRVQTRRTHAAAQAAVQEQEAQAAAARVEVALVWEARLARVAQLRGTLVEAVQAWPSGAGYSLQVRLPQGGATWRHLAACVDGLAADADLPHGCGVEVAPGPSRQVAILQVATVDTTALPQPYPDDTSPLTFTQPLPVGMLRAARPAQVLLLEDPMLLIGRRGSGKTNVLQVLNADLVRCTDVLVWHIDLNGAGMSRPWLTPWLRGTTGRPVIDWVAATVDEAEIMLDTAIAVAKRRKTAYAALMDEVDDDKLPISPAVPAIVVVLDEGAEAVAASRGHQCLAAKLDELVSIARAARVQVLASALRAVAEILPTSIKAQAGTRLFMRPDDEHEVAQLLGWRTGVSLDDVSAPGAGLLRTAESAAVAPMRAWRMAPAQITALTAAVTDRRPHLDAPSAAAAGPIYTHRWTRYLTWYASQGGTAMPQHIPGTGNNTGSGNAGGGSGSAQDNTTGSGNAAATGPTGAAGELTGMAALGPAYEALQASLAELRKVGEAAERRRAGGEQAAPASGTGGDDAEDLDRVFAEIVSGWDEAAGDPAPADGSADPGDGQADQAAQPPVTSVGPPVDGPAVMLQVLRGAERGMHWEQLLTALEAQGVAVAKATLYRWLRDAEAAGQAHSPTRGWWAPGSPRQ